MPDGRKRAEERFIATDTDIANLSADDARTLVQELQDHQTELEMQNEDLRETQAQLAEARDRYADLYDVAPVGYVTLDDKRAVREVNCTICTMLGTDRGALLGHRLTELAAPEHRDDCFRWTVHHVSGLPPSLIGEAMADEEEPHARVAFQTGQPMAVADALHDDRVNTEHMRKHNVRAVLAVPLVIRKKPERVLFFNRSAQH